MAVEEAEAVAVAEAEAKALAEAAAVAGEATRREARRGDAARGEARRRTSLPIVNVCCVRRQNGEGDTRFRGECRAWATCRRVACRHTG